MTRARTYAGARPARGAAADRGAPAVAVVVAIGAVVIGAAGAGCGGGAQAPETEEPEEFSCKDRRAAYIAANAFAGPEVGVVMDCAERGPRIKRWVVLNEGGDRQTSEHSLTPEEFEAVWEKVNATGWRNLEDCTNPDAAEGDPEYKIGVADDQASTAVQCAGKVLPFPYNRIVTELDLIAAKYS